MWCGRGPMLSKNLEYMGQDLNSFQRREPINADPNSSTASLSKKSWVLPPSSKAMWLKPSFFEVRGPFWAAVVEENQRSSMPPRMPPKA